MFGQGPLDFFRRRNARGRLHPRSSGCGAAVRMRRQFQRIVALPLYGIGDVLMTTPALRNIKQKLGASITYLHMFQSTKEILEGNPFVDENIHFPFLDAGRAASVRFLLKFRGRFDASINFYPSNRRDYSLAAFIIGSPVRIGHRYDTYDLRELNFLKNRTVRERAGLHNVEENMRLLELLGGGEAVAGPMEIYLNDEETEFASGWLKERAIEGARLIGIHAGASAFKNHYNKRWPADRFAGLIAELGCRYPDAAFLVFGGPEEEELKEALREASGIARRAHNVRGGIRQSAALVQRCRAFVTNDSGLMHMAAALQVPTVAIFGPTNPAWVRPWMCPHRVVSLGPHCGPCFRYSPAPLRCREEKDFSCLAGIGVDDVLGAAVSLLEPEAVREHGVKPRGEPR
jgi:heptosyltransferase-2